MKLKIFELKRTRKTKTNLFQRIFQKILYFATSILEFCFEFFFFKSDKTCVLILTHLLPCKYYARSTLVLNGLNKLKIDNFLKLHTKTYILLNSSLIFKKRQHRIYFKMPRRPARCSFITFVAFGYSKLFERFYFIICEHMFFCKLCISVR